MEVIWYNAYLSTYEKGTLEEFKHLKNTSSTPESVELIFKMTPFMTTIGEKILNSLNQSMESQKIDETAFELA